MLNCHDATFLMSQSLERKLSFGERMKLRLHVGMCRGCANASIQFPLLRSEARSFASEELPSADLHEENPD